MFNIESPFINQIQECKIVMKKLRKKISKHFLTTPPNRKSSEQNHDLLNILKSRNLPNFVIDLLKKRRSIDFNCLKNVMISNMASPQQISKLTSNQQNQIKSLLTQHKQRIRKFKKKSITSLRIDKKINNYINQQQQESLSSSNIEQNKSYSLNEDQFIHMRPQINQNHFEYDGLMLNGLSFLSLRKQESDQQWLKF